MIAVDTNVLVNAHRREARYHEQGYSAMALLARGAEPWALPWPCVAEFICVVTNPGLFKPASTAEEAVDQVRAWREAPSCRLINETGRTEETFLQLVVGSKHVVGARVYDARIAAICLDHGVTELWTADRDYGYFPKLKVRNPTLDDVT